MTRVLDWLGYWFLSAFAVFLRLLPLRLALGLGSLLGKCVYFLSNRRRVAYADMKAAFQAQYHGKELWRRVRDHYANHGRMLVEVLRFPLLDKEFLDKNIEIEGLDRYLKLVKEQKGIVLLTAHFGNWELLQIVSGLLGRPVHALAREQKFPKLDSFLNNLRESHGSVAIMRGMGIREILKSLKKGHLVGLLGDQDAGKHQGLIIPLFGRKTTIPLGAFQLAARTQTLVLPCFIARGDDKKSHHICVGEPIECPEAPKENPEEHFRPYVRRYVDALESFIRKYPNQWLWETKRWKYTWTKRLLILSDGKPGHYKQSQAVATQFQKITHQYERPGMEYPTETLEVQYKSEWHRKLFVLFSVFFIPFSQGRLNMLRFFFQPNTQKKLEKVTTDFIISAGSSLIPLNLILARETRAKSVVLMKPNFPFNHYRYDLAFVPKHDRGRMPKKEVFRTTLTPSIVETEALERDREKLAQCLRNPRAIEMALFLGGPTGQYDFETGKIREVFSALERWAFKAGDYVVTTSRRTKDEVASFLKEEVAVHQACQMVVIGAEDRRPEVVGGMMALAEILVVTEDSISMISEAAATGKKVVILELNPERLATKHQRFKEELKVQGVIATATPETLEQVVLGLKDQPRSQVVDAENQAVLEKLQAIL